MHALSQRRDFPVARFAGGDADTVHPGVHGDMKIAGLAGGANTLMTGGIDWYEKYGEGVANARFRKQLGPTPTPFATRQKNAFTVVS